MGHDQWVADIEADFGRRVRERRQQLEKSQDWLAKQLQLYGIQLHQTAVAKIEAGTRPLRLSEAAALSSALEVPLHTLIFDTHEDSERLAEAESHGRIGELFTLIHDLERRVQSLMDNHRATHVEHREET